MRDEWLLYKGVEPANNREIGLPLPRPLFDEMADRMSVDRDDEKFINFIFLSWTFIVSSFVESTLLADMLLHPHCYVIYSICESFGIWLVRYLFTNLFEI